MIRRALGLAAIGTLLACAALAGPPAGKTKLITLHTCPITGDKVEGAGAGSETVGNYKVSFCCAGCKPMFDKMSAKDKDKKLVEIARKEAAKQKG